MSRDELLKLADEAARREAYYLRRARYDKAGRRRTGPSPWRQRALLARQKAADLRKQAEQQETN